MSSPNYALRHLGQDNASYSSECVEEKFSEVRGSKVGQPLPYLGHRAGVLTLWPFIHERRGKNRNSRKFTVASNHSDAAVSTRQQPGGTPSASERSDLVAVVAPLCIKELRLVTAQLPEKSGLIGPGHKRTSPLRSSRKMR